LRGLKIFLLLCLSTILVITGWVHLAGLSMEKTVFNSSYYREVFEKTGLASSLHAELKANLPDMVADEIAREMEKELANDISDFEKEVYRNMVELVTTALLDTFDEDWIEEQLFIVIDDLVAFATGEQQELVVEIDISENKQEIKEKVIDTFDNLPPPVKERLGIQEGQTSQYVEEMLSEMDLPDRIQLNELVTEGNNKSTGDLEHSLSTLQGYRGLYLYLPYLVYAISLTGSLLLAGFSGGLKWFGAAVLFFSATFLLGIQVFPGFAEQMILPGVENELPLSKEMHQSIVAYTLDQIRSLPLISGAVGIVFLAGGFISGPMLRKKPRKRHR